MTLRRVAFAPALLMACTVAGTPVHPALAASTPARALDFEMPRYLGRWHVIARTAGARDGEPGASLEFAVRADGSIAETYRSQGEPFAHRARTEERTAQALAGEPALWQVRYGWFSTAERRVLYVSADYRHALVSDGAGHAWMLARTPEIAEWSYAGLLARLALHGYDVSRIRRVPQTPEQVGRRGYE